MPVQQSRNPATGDVIRDYAQHDEAQVQQAIARAQQAFVYWKAVPIAERARLLSQVADALLAGKEGYARLITQEMGKPLKEALAEIEKCAGCGQYFAQHGPGFLADRPIDSEYRRSYVSFQPLGVILGIMPWNFPFWQLFRFAFPTLLAGNSVLLKHASNVPGCALAIASLCVQAGLPEYLLQALLIHGERVEDIIAHPYVAGVSLTGSTQAGRSVASIAGRHLKKTVLELGGSDPYVVLEDADIDQAVQVCAAGRLLNGGQSCISAKRLIVVEKVRERFTQGLLERFKQQRLGDPLGPHTTIGPMARQDLRDELHKQVQQSIKAGAKLLLGGEIPQGQGAYYPPTILSAVAKGMKAYHEELFGPVAVIIPAQDEEEAIHIAGDSEFGLGGAVFTQDVARGERIARERIDSGSCFVNMMVRSDTRFPFGGVKQSGYGRELSAFGIHEFVNIKSIVVA